MSAASPLQPTLWRTCRVLANRTRLRLLKLLFRQPGLSVSAVAKRLDLSLSRASLSLRALEARGLLTVQRVGSQVIYRPNAAPVTETAQALVPALRLALQRNAAAVEEIFKVATAFTHPRRIELFRILKNQGQTLGQLRSSTKMSGWALRRHLRKLEARGLVRGQQRSYVATGGASGFGQVLTRLAAR